IADLKVYVADAALFGKADPGGAFGGSEQILYVERIGAHFDAAIRAVPARDGTVGIDLDAIAFRIGEIDRLADDVVGSAVEGYVGPPDMAEPAREIGARRHEEGRVEEAGLP